MNPVKQLARREGWKGGRVGNNGSGQGRLEWWICVTALAGKTPLTVRKYGKLPLLPSGNNNNNNKVTLR